MKSVLIIQEGGGHGEVLGGFMDALSVISRQKSIDISISVLCGNSYGIFALYDELGYEFIAYDRENPAHIERIRGLILDKSFDLIIFNSSPIWEKTTFNSAALESSGAEILVLHHSNLRNELSHPFFKLGTSVLLDPVVDQVFTPYYEVDVRLSHYRKQSDISRCLAFLGTHYPAALTMRDSERLQKLFEKFESSAFETDSFAINWFVAHLSDGLKELFGSSRVFRVGLSHLDIYKEVLSRSCFWGTCYKKNTRYERDGMTGTVPFALNGGMPVIGSSSFLSIYRFPDSYVDFCSRLDADMMSVKDVADVEYQYLVQEAIKVRDGERLRNQAFLSGVMGL